jgi:hypothetical protein
MDNIPNRKAEMNFYNFISEFDFYNKYHDIEDNLKTAQDYKASDEYSKALEVQQFLDECLANQGKIDLPQNILYNKYIDDEIERLSQLIQMSSSEIYQNLKDKHFIILKEDWDKHLLPKILDSKIGGFYDGMDIKFSSDFSDVDFNDILKIREILSSSGLNSNFKLFRLRLGLNDWYEYNRSYPRETWWGQITNSVNNVDNENIKNTMLSFQAFLDEYKVFVICVDSVIILISFDLPAINKGNF